MIATDLRLALDPDEFARAAGLDGELDEWQRAVLDAGEQKLLLDGNTHRATWIAVSSPK